jgi:parallel beta-helix repeat protein
VAEVDRGAYESRGLEEKKLPRVVMVTFFVAVLFTASLSLLPGPASDIPPTPVPAGILYTVHGTISINGNAGFNNTNFPNNGVVSGNGTASNPYVISGWNISAASASGIQIQNTNAYFEVRDCHVYDGSLGIPTPNDGIDLYNCANGTLSNNNCSNNVCGIYLYDSSNNTLVNNTCNSNGVYGIVLDLSSNYNTLNNNNCSNNDYGIYLYDSSNGNTLVNNTCNSNGVYGIVLDLSSDSNTISSNTCNFNSDYGIYLDSSISNTLTNNTCSSNNWLGIYLDSSSHYNTLNNNNCSNNDYGIYLYTSSSNTISNNTCSNNRYGITISVSSGNNLTGNTCNLNTQNGIRLSTSSNNVISWNEVCNNTLQGVNITSGSNNRIWNNTFINNNGVGVQAYDAGTNNRWNTSSGFGNYWDDLTTPDLNFDGIVDWSYNLTGAAGAKDWYPLTTPTWPIPEFSEIIIPIVGLMLIALIIGRTRKKP